MPCVCALLFTEESTSWLLFAEKNMVLNFFLLRDVSKPLTYEENIVHFFSNPTVSSK